MLRAYKYKFKLLNVLAKNNYFEINLCVLILEIETWRCPAKKLRIANFVEYGNLLILTYMFCRVFFLNNFSLC